jgi:spore coat polysaccharide biosynthesis predicted glycosyltransferase SpsG
MGMGHISRCISLAKRLLPSADVRFITKSDDQVVAIIREAGFEADVINAEYETVLDGLNCDTVVVDKLDVEESLARCIREQKKCRLCIMGNLSTANKYANVVVNAVIGSQLRNRRHKDSVTGTLFLEGPRYFVLRDQFYSLQGSYKHRGRMQKLMLIYGGSDPANLTCASLEGILDGSIDCDITLCTGALFKYSKELDIILKRRSSSRNSVRVISNANNVAELMMDSDLVLTSGGVTLFEALCLGVPALAFFQNDFQRSMFREIPFAMEFPGKRGLVRQLERCYTLFCDWQGWIDHLAPGQGVTEITNAILVSRHSSNVG